MPRISRLAIVVLLLFLFSSCADHRERDDTTGNSIQEFSEDAITFNPTRMNILLIVADALRADHVSAYGYERNTTPHIDQFATESTLFEQAYSHSSWTLP